MLYKIEKVLNNNAAVIINEKGKETVVMGRGIAFHKKARDTIPSEIIEKTFTLTTSGASGRFQELVTDVPIEHILVSEKIISYAKSTIGKKFSDNIYLTLTDHISSAIQRYSEGIILKNALLWDIRQFYQDEFEMGMRAVEMIRDSLDVEFTEDEAAFMALHFVSAQMDGNMTWAHESTKLIQEITNIVKYNFQIEYNPESLSYYRFISHLKFFSQRLFKKKSYDDESDEILSHVIEKNPKAYQCAQTIASFISGRYNYDLTTEELLYMTVHVARVVKEARAQRSKNSSSARN